MEVVRLTSDTLELELLPAAGARLHRLRAFGHDLLRTPDDPRRHLDDPFFWGAYVMAPWANRLAARPTDALGRTVALASTFRDGSAIHGQVYSRAWTQVADAAFEVRAGGDGWPWPYEVRLDVTVSDTSVLFALRLTNLADAPMPGGLGLHPWFRRPLDAAINGASVFRSNEPSPPKPSPVTGAHDMRTVKAFPFGLDATWSDLATPPVELHWPGPGVRATMTTEAATTFVVAASPPDINAAAIELQTHAPSGLRRLLAGELGPLAVVRPGEDIRLAVRMDIVRG